MSTPLSERAKLRLRLAAGLLRAEGITFECPRETFYDTIQAELANLPTDRRERLKALVDWAESYEAAAESFTPPRQTQRPARSGR